MWTALGLGVDCYYLQIRSVNLGGRCLTLWVELPSVVTTEGAQRGLGEVHGKDPMLWSERDKD